MTTSSRSSTCSSLESATVKRGTVGWFAMELRKDANTLLEQLRAAGVAKEGASATLTEQDKQALLCYLQDSHGTAAPERKPITLVVRGVKRQVELAGADERSPGSEDKVIATADASRANRIILVGNMGEPYERYHLARSDGSIASFSPKKLAYELQRAFWCMHRRNPDAGERAALEELRTRLGRLLAEMAGRCRGQIRVALKRSVEGLTSLYSAVLLQAIYALAHPGRQGNELALRLFCAHRVKDVPTSQQGLHVGSGRNALASIASAAWRLLRSKHLLPDHAATISLA